MISLDALARHVSEKKLASPFEPLARAAYLLLAIQMVASLVLVNWLGFTVAQVMWKAMLGWPLMLAGGMMMRRLDWSRAATFVESMGVTYALAWNSFFVLAPLAAISAPFADSQLDAMDRLLGFDFAAYADFVRPYVEVLRLGYASYNWQPLLIVAYLCWTKRTTAVWAFVAAGSLALLITSAIFPFFPAQGPFVFYGFVEYGEITAPWDFGPVLQALKDGERLLDYSLMTGLVSLPSYHAAAACIYLWAAWPTALRWIVVPLNAVLLPATIVIGSHYLVDIIAGIVVGLVAILVTSRFLVRQGEMVQQDLEARHEPAIAG